MIPSLYEQLEIGAQGESEICLMSDMPVLLQCAAGIYAGLFDKYLKCSILTTVSERVAVAYQQL